MIVQTFTRFFLVRALERALPIAVLRGVLTPLAMVRTLKRKKTSVSLPGCLGEPRNVTVQGKRSFNTRMNEVLQSVPDKLATPRWRSRCSIIGLERLLDAVQQKQPAIIAMCHCGPYRLLRPWLRAAGVPIFALTLGGKRGAKIPQLRNARSPFPDVPISFDRQHLRDAVEFLLKGNIMLMAIDVSFGKQIEVPAGNGWQFQMATGALRLAAQHRVPLLPVSIVEDGRWRFRIEVGEAVPSELLADESDLLCAGEHLLAHLMSAMRRHPEQCERSVLLHFRPVTRR